jgi:type I restriction enzyme R subunit
MASGRRYFENNNLREVRPRFDDEFMPRSIQAFYHDNEMLNDFMQDQDARDMRKGQMFPRLVHGARGLP